MGVSKNRGTPKTPQNEHFLLGKPIVVGYHHFRKHPYTSLYFIYFMVNYANFLRFTSSKTLVKQLLPIWKKSPFFGDSSHTISSIKLKGTTTNNQNLPTRWIPRCCCGCCGGYCGAAGGGAYCCMALGWERFVKAPENHRRLKPQKG